MTKITKQSAHGKTMPRAGRAKLQIKAEDGSASRAERGKRDTSSAESKGIGASLPVDLADARKRIESLVTASSEKIGIALISAAEAGKLAEAKYLFELVGMFPAARDSAFKPENSLAYRLLKRLGLPTEPVEREAENQSAGEDGVGYGKDQVVLPGRCEGDEDAVK
jgi:hypothetical protein